MNIGKALKAVRERAGLHQSEAAKKAGTTQKHISNLENNHKKPHPDMLKRLADAYGYPVPLLIWFMIEEEDVPKAKRPLFLALKPSFDKMIEDLL